MKNAIETQKSSQANVGLWDEFDRMFENFFTATPTGTYASSRLMRPAYDIEESDSRYLLSFDLPGMKQEDINIEVHDRVLSISGERKREESSVRHSERFYGKFERQFALPENVNVDAVEANYEHGVLKIFLGKSEEVKPRKIQIGTKAPAREAKDVQ